MTTNQSNRKSLTGLVEGATASSNLDITGNVNMKGFKLFNLGLGTDLQDSTNKTQLDAVVSDISIIDNSISIIEISLNSIGNNDASFQAIDASLQFLDLSGVQFSLGINKLDISVNKLETSISNLETSSNFLEASGIVFATSISNLETSSNFLEASGNVFATSISNLETSSNFLEASGIVFATSISNLETSSNFLEASGNVFATRITTLETSSNFLEASGIVFATSISNLETSSNFLEASGAVFALDIGTIESSCNIYEASINAITGSPWTETTDGRGDAQLKYDSGTIKVDGNAVMGCVQLDSKASFGHNTVFENQPLNMALEQNDNGSTFIRCGLTDSVHQFITFNGNNSSQRMIIRGDGGGVGIGVSLPTFPLEIDGYKVNGGSVRWVYLNGAVPATGQVQATFLTSPTATTGAHNQNRMSVSASHGFLTNTGFLQASDDRIKSFEKPIEVGLKEILQLEPKHYLKHPTIFVDADDETGETLPKDEEGKLFQMTEDGEKEPLDCDFELGLISQAVEKIEGLEILVSEEYNGIKNVNYVGLVPVLIKAIQEMEAKRKEDNKKFIDLNKRLLILEEKLKNIESTEKEYIL